MRPSPSPGAPAGSSRRGRSAVVVLLALPVLTGCTSVGTAAAPPAAPPSSSAAPPTAGQSSAGPSQPGTTAVPPAPTAAATAATAPPATGAAADALGRLTVRGRGSKTGYSRDAFGAAWADVDRNGCDTRNDVLRRDLQDLTFREGTRDCVVLSGTLAEPYTGRTVVFTRSDATAVQIDHLVALSDAWQKGAAQWSPERRLAFANDPLGLLAVDGPTNARKGDGDAATWLPPARGFRCRYVARQVAVKQAYALSVTAAERDAIARVLASCPGEPLPGPDRVPAAGPTAVPTATPSLQPPGPPAAAAAGDPDYGTCRNAIAHGAGPYRRGQVEYDYYRDADHDGVVCER